MVNADIQRTLVVLKPDAVQRRLLGQIIQRFERKGLKIVAAGFRLVSRDLAETLYAVHKGQDFHEGLLRFITSGPVMTLVLEGKGAVDVVRALAGPTFGPAAPPGTIRGDFGMSMRFNLVHASDSPDSARRETDLFFRPEEIVQYDLSADQWTYDRSAGGLI